MSIFKKLFSSKILNDANETQRIVYIALMTSLTVICNMFFEFKLAETQFSLTIFFSAMSGMIIGPIGGFVASFLGDLVGFLVNSGGFAYLPWIGLCMGITAFISGITMNCFNFKSKFAIYFKIGIICVLTFFICTIAINTTAFWIVYNGKKVPYFAYLVTRLFVQGQIYNSIVNYFLLFISYPVILQITKTLLKEKNLKSKK